MSIIDRINKNISDVINKDNAEYKALFGSTPFTPEPTIIKSEDINCGALCNELEFVKLFSDYIVDSFGLNTAEDDELDALINGLIDLQRLWSGETNQSYRDRFSFLVVDQVNTRRITKWSILDAIKHVVTNAEERVQIIEPFDSKNLYFEVRIEGQSTLGGILFLDTPNFSSYLDIDFIGGLGTGAAITYLEYLIQRIKPAGVDFDIIIIEQDRFIKMSDAKIVLP